MLQVLQAAVCPERRYGVDDELSAIATVTEVELSKDLAVAKIYIQIYSDPTGQDVAWDGLQRLQGCATRTVGPSHVCIELAEQVVAAVAPRGCRQRTEAGVATLGVQVCAAAHSERDPHALLP